MAVLVEKFTKQVYSKQMDQLELFSEAKPDDAAKSFDIFIEPSVPTTGLASWITTGIPDKLFEVSIDAYDAVVHARMSELLPEKDILYFMDKVMSAIASFKDCKTAEARAAANRAASDRGDPAVLAVLKASYKAQHEIHRLIGLLRFNPNDKGLYIACCSPDHFILPGLAEHFFLRFGETPWAIIDEKRKLCLCRQKGGFPELVTLSVFQSLIGNKNSQHKDEIIDPWEDLWRLYHRSVNNEARKNLRLQRQLMPERYQKYLPEKR